MSFDAPPRFQMPDALRITAFGAGASFTFTLAFVAADLASQVGSAAQQPLWFGLADGTAALGFWKMWDWISRRVRIT